MTSRAPTITADRPTRERILDQALRLFAEQGYEATTIGEIETAAGLAPRSGALYKHYPSKRALIDAALAERFGNVDAIDERLAAIESMPAPAGGDLRAELTLIAGLALEELESERDLSRLVMKEGERFPELADAFHAGLVDRGHRIAASWLTNRSAALGVDLPDVDATAQVLTDALVGYVLQDHIFGGRTTRVERGRFLAAWTRVVSDHLRNDRPTTTTRGANDDRKR